MGAIATSKAEVSVNEQLAEELHKSVTKKFKRRKVFARVTENIWAPCLDETESLSPKNENLEHLLCLIDVFNKYAWVIPFKDEVSKVVLNVFIEIVNKSNRKPNRLWVNQGREFYSKLMRNG